jgi:hypothetical protein
MRKINLYTTVGCHLCEQAHALLRQAQVIQAQVDHPGFEIRAVEISESETLMATYGIRIPVIRFDDAPAELAWPFTYEDLQVFLTSDCAAGEQTQRSGKSS